MNQLTLLSFALIFSVLSCSENTGNESKKASILNRNEENAPNGKSLGDQKSMLHEDKSEKKSTLKLIKSGRLELKSKNISESKSRLDKTIGALEGYYDNEQFTKTEYENRYSLQIRVPAKNFAKLLNSISRGSDEIVSKNITTDDVSEEYYDIETRLKSKRAYLQRYQEIMSNAKNVDELLKIEAEIRSLIEEIESSEGRMRFLNDQIGFSTLNVELYRSFSEKNAAEREPGFIDNALASMKIGWHIVVTLFLGLLAIWPFLLAGSVVWIFVRKRLKSKPKE